MNWLFFFYPELDQGTIKINNLTISEEINYIIIGANGFIGKKILSHLSGANIIAIGRSNSHTQIGNEKYYSIHKFSLDQIANSHRGLKCIVIDLSYASVSNVSVKDTGRDFADNINLIINNMKFARAIGAVKYIYM